MSKFIALPSGSYIKIDCLTGIYIRIRKDKYQIVAYKDIRGFDEEGNSCNEDIEWCLQDNFNSREEAQEWLDKFMDKYDLVIQPVTQSRCY